MPCLRNSWTTVVVAASLLIPAVVAAEPPAPDPVEALRDALRRPAADELARTANLTPAADALHSLGDLGRALLLAEWRDDDRKFPLMNADREARDKVLARFGELVRKAMAGPDAAARQAAATLIGETAVRAREGGGAFDAAAVVGRAQVREHLSDLAPDLMKLMMEDDAAVRAAAVCALGKVQPEASRAVPAIAKLLTHTEIETKVRRAAALALNDLLATAAQDGKRANDAGADPDKADQDCVVIAGLVLPTAVEALRDTDSEVTRLCGQAIHKTADTLLELVPEQPSGLESGKEVLLRLERKRQNLQPLLGPFDRYLHQLATQRAEEIGSRAATWQLLRVAAIARRRLRRYGELDDPLPALPDTRYLLEFGLDDADAKVRLAAVTALREFEQDAAPAASRLAEVLRKDSSPDVRLAAAQTLGAVGPAASIHAVPALIDALQDPKEEIRQAAAAGLVPFATASTEKIVAALASAAKRDGGPRLAALQALAMIGEKATVAGPEVIAALDDPDSAVRVAAAVAMGRFGKQGESVRAALRKALDDPDPAVRLAAAAALLSGK